MIKHDIKRNNFKNQNNFVKLVLTLLHSLCYNPTQWLFVGNNKRQRIMRIKEVIP